MCSAVWRKVIRGSAPLAILLTVIEASSHRVDRELYNPHFRHCQTIRISGMRQRRNTAGVHLVCQLGSTVLARDIYHLCCEMRWAQFEATALSVLAKLVPVVCMSPGSRVG